MRNHYLNYDKSAVAGLLVRAVLLTITEGDQGATENLLYDYSRTGKIEKAIPNEIAGIFERYGPVAALLKKFVYDLWADKNKSIPYPSEELDNAWKSLPPK